MGLLQKATETYDYMADLAGKYKENKEPLAPVGHIISKADIEITIDDSGNFISALNDKERTKIIIPVTVDSASRSGKKGAVAPHALTDKLFFYDPKKKESYEIFVTQLEDWCDSDYTHPMAEAILKYVKKGQIISDLRNNGIKFSDKEEEFVRWRVTGLGDKSGATWTESSLMQAYTKYYLSHIGDGEKNICMITGRNEIVTDKHLKGVVASSGNAKIISANDSVNYTYRGRFVSPDEVVTIGYESSQKAHNALKWLVANEGAIEDGRAFVCWNPRGIQIPKPQFTLFNRTEEKCLPTQYGEALRKIIRGYKSNLNEKDDVIIASFDAATTGRLSITYYNELKASDFLDRLLYWDESCCWYDMSWGTSSPSLYNIVNYAFGTQRGEGDSQRIETDSRILKQHKQRLINCRVNKAKMPTDIMKAIVQKAGNLQIYEQKNRRVLLFTACAVVKKYLYDNFKEEWSMALESQKKDRSYQYGRLLAVMEKAERDTYKPDEKREANAIRMQSVFVKRPAYATKIIIEQLKSAYYPQLKTGSRIYYDRLIGEIMDIISQFPNEEFNKPLSETYLLGYYLQRNSLWTKQNKNEDNNETEEKENE